MKILITGSAGFIASHLIPKLRDRGHTIFTYDLDSSFNQLLGVEYDCIVHLAGITQNYQIQQNREEFLKLSINLLQKIMQLPTKKFIFPSSGKVYGEGQNLKETQLCQPKNDLGKVKLILENILSYRQGTNIILRLFNVFGPNQHESFLIPTIVRQSQSGNVIKLGDVLTGRDYIYIDDVCDAFIKVIEREYTPETHIYNISSGYSTTAKEIVDIISLVENKKLQIVTDKSKLRLDEHNHENGNNEKARLDLKWKIGYSIKQGIESIIKRLSNF